MCEVPARTEVLRLQARRAAAPPRTEQGFPDETPAGTGYLRVVVITISAILSAIMTLRTPQRGEDDATTPDQHSLPLGKASADARYGGVVEVKRAADLTPRAGPCAGLVRTWARSPLAVISSFLQHLHALRVCADPMCSISRPRAGWSADDRLATEGHLQAGTGWRVRADCGWLGQASSIFVPATT